jgi:chromosome segregation ATPase
MTQDTEIRERRTYTIRNEDTSPRIVIVEHPVRRGYELRGDVKPVETTVDWMRFRLPVESKQTASLVVEEARSQTHSFVLSNLNSQNVELFVRQKSIDKTLEDALRKVLAQKTVIQELSEKKNSREAGMTKIFDDQQRLRENMKALKGSVEEKALLQRYTQQLNEQETQLAALRKESDDLAAQAVSAQSALDQTIQDLSFDVTLAQ